MLNLAQLTPESTLNDIPSHRFQVNATTLGREVAQTFEQQRNLPGVIILDNSQMIGVISRRRFLERMSQPFSLEIYLKRPVHVLLDVIKAQPTQMPNNCKIVQAAQMALSRFESEVYEPIVLLSEEGELRLIDFHELLLAQSHILSIVNNIINQQKAEADRYLKRIKQEQERVKEYTKLMEAKQVENQERNRVLEAQKLELVKQSQEIAQLNDKFVRVGQLLSTEGKKAFQATFEGVTAICNATDQIVEIGKSLTRELESVNNTSKLIADVSQQVRHLSVQAAVVANQSGAQFQGFGQITTEIGKLVSQTFDAGSQMNQVATRFKLRIQDLTYSAQAETVAARSLVQKIERAEAALKELENLVLDQSRGIGLELSSSHEAQADAIDTNALTEKLDQTELAVSQLERITSQQNKQVSLADKIEQTLKQAKNPLHQ